MFNLRRLIHNKRGAHIVILALIFPACIVTMAAIIDIGLFYTSRAHMQNAVDAAAIAGAKKLPATSANHSSVVAIAKSFIQSHPEDQQDSQPIKNYVADARVAVDFSSDFINFGPTGKKYCRVTLTAPANSIVLKNILKRTPLITVQAVAARESAGYAIFADDGVSKDNQNALWLSVNSVTIEGNIHSNRDLAMKSTGSTVTNGQFTVVDYTGSASDVTTVNEKEEMPDPTKMPGEIREINHLTLDHGVGKEALPILYIAETGDIAVQVNTVDACYANFYAPNGNISFQGNNFKLYGCVVAKSIDFQLNALEIHAPAAWLNAQVKLVR